MFKEDVTRNIYTSWLMTAGIKKARGRFIKYYALRELEEFKKEELENLIWLLHEELKTRGKHEFK